MPQYDYSAAGFQDIAVELSTSGPNAGIAILYFNAPSRLNAVTKLLTLEYIKAFYMLQNDSRVRCVVVTGKGKAFAAGASFHGKGAKTFDYSAVKKDEHRDGTGRGVVAIGSFTKPVIAAWASSNEVGTTAQMGD